MNISVEQNNMITQQLRTGDVLSEDILALYDVIPRHEFVPQRFKHFAYSDSQHELPHGQRMMTPLEEGLLLQSLQLNGTETVLEVGTGSGFLTALLSRLSKKVVSVDYFSDLTTHATQLLNQYDCKNIELFTGDASEGWVDKAPYDVVVFTGALDALNETHRLQIVPGGKIFAIIGQSPIMQGQLFELNHQNQWSSKVIFETCLPPLIRAQTQNGFIF